MCRDEIPSESYLRVCCQASATKCGACETHGDSSCGMHLLSWCNLRTGGTKRDPLTRFRWQEMRQARGGRKPCHGREGFLVSDFTALNYPMYPSCSWAHHQWQFEPPESSSYDDVHFVANMPFPYAKAGNWCSNKLKRVEVIYQLNLMSRGWLG